MKQGGDTSTHVIVTDPPTSPRDHGGLMNSNSLFSHYSMWNSSLCYWWEDPVPNPECHPSKRASTAQKLCCYFWRNDLKRKRAGNFQNRNL